MSLTANDPGAGLHCRTYYDCRSVDTRIQAHQGGSRSGKTWSICEWLIEQAMEDRSNESKVVTICRKTMPAVKATVQRDFMEILWQAGQYNRKSHNRTENTYLLHKTLFEFISVDDPQKVRGRKRHVLFMNEANEFSFDDYTQLALRTTGRIIIDYNPSEEYHWIYDKVLIREDCSFFKSSYKDNPFLGEETIKEIELLQQTDLNLWKVFGLGERGASVATIYTRWELIDSLPEGGIDVYGLDFGYNDPAVLIHLRIRDSLFYIDEVLYSGCLTNSDLIEKLVQLMPDKRTPIYADAAEPQRIEEIHREGFNIRPADKSVRDGIDRLRRSRLFITSRSANLLKEIRSYKYMRDKNGRVLEWPEPGNDHAMDALRYAAHTHFKLPSGKYAIL